VDSEIPLSGGRVTHGVVRVGATVRRPVQANSSFVRSLLIELHDSGFEAAPRYLGTDESGREVFSFLPGYVPPDLDPTISDETLAAAASLIRRYHDATASLEIAAPHEVVCHNDLSPCNFVFRDQVPAAIIDFDAAAPGERLDDLGCAIFLWLNLGTDGPDPIEQARRINVFCRGYGIEPTTEVVRAVVAAVAKNTRQLRDSGRMSDAEWWETQHDWLTRHQGSLV
jgi:Phosphotransferase enzyme family